MATPLSVILSWFKTGDFPTQIQFANAWSSFWHKDDPIPQENIQNLTTDLDNKAERLQLESHVSDPDAHAALFAAIYTPYRHISLGISIDTDFLTLPALVGAELDGVAYQNQMINEGIDFDPETGILSGYPFKASTKILIFYTKL